MDHIHLGILALLGSGLTGEVRSLPEGFDLTEAYPYLRRHQIQPIAYLGAVTCGIDKKNPVMVQLFRDYCAALQYSENQAAQLEELFAAMDAEGVDYMPLKGCELKKLYPRPEMRTMGDVDILIRMEQYEGIVPIMERLGYRPGKESDHELVWQKDRLMVELHKRLFPSHNKDLHGYFGNGWARARVVAGTRYAMSPEDTFAYLVSHFAKHYRDGGIGCRHVADLWLYRRANPQMDPDYLHDQLRAMHLERFYDSLCTMLSFWFEDGRGGDRARLMTQVIFESGSWGERSSHILADALRNKKGGQSVLGAKIKRLWKLTFLPLRLMKQKYPVLVRLPVLLPVFWVVRAVQILFTKGKLTQHSREFVYMSQQRVDEYEQALHYVGLDFNFEE